MFKESKLNWTLLVIIILLIMLLSAGLTLYFKTGFDFNFIKKEEKEFTINPEVKIDSNKDYTITYWDYPLFIGQNSNYNKFLTQTISEFNKFYPNIKINYKLLSFKEGEEKLKKSLKTGNPPDIYNNINNAQIYDKELQIPINLLFKATDKEEYSKLAIKTLTFNDKLWGIPQWLLPQVWVGNRKLLQQTGLDLITLRKKGWSKEEFSQISQQLKEDKKYIIFNPYNSDLFYQLLIANGRSELITETGQLLLTSKDLTAAFSFLEELRSNKVFPNKIAQMNKKILPYYWQKRAAIIAPVNFWLLNNIYQRDIKRKNIELSLLPIPGGEKNPVKITSLVLFKQEDYKGDDHTKAAYQFAQFINHQKNLSITRKLRVLPAYLPLQATWKLETDLKEEIKNQLLSYANKGEWRKLNHLDKGYESKITEVINRNYLKFWLKGLSTSEVVSNIMKEIKELNIKSYQKKEE